MPTLGHGREMYMIYLRVIVLAIGLMTAIPAISAEFDWNQYKSTTIEGLIKSVDDSTKDTGPNFENRRGVHVGVLRYKAVVQFTGKFRDIPKQHAEFIEGLPKVYKFVPPEIIHLYSRELLLQEGALQIWSPVQEVLVKPLQDELRVGDTFEVYFYYLGATFADHMLGINEFQKTSKP
jgi:hypothetical protein